MISWVVALHTVLDTAEPVTLCWAAVIRSVKLWPDISAAPPPPLPLGSRRGLGPPSAGGLPPPTAPPTPTGSFSACRPGAGLRAARCHPARKEPARVTRGVRHGVGHSPAPASAQPTPSLVSWSRAGQERQAAAGKWRRQAPPRSFPGCPGSRDAGAAPPPSPAPFPFPFLFDARPPSLGEGRAGRRPRVTWWNPPGGRNRRPARGECAAAASRDAPCQQVARGWARGGHRVGEGRPRKGGGRPPSPTRWGARGRCLKPAAWQRGGAAAFTAPAEDGLSGSGSSGFRAESRMCLGTPPKLSWLSEKGKGFSRPNFWACQQASPYCATVEARPVYLPQKGWGFFPFSWEAWKCHLFLFISSLKTRCCQSKFRYQPASILSRGCQIGQETRSFTGIWKGK